MCEGRGRLKTQEKIGIELVRLQFFFVVRSWSERQDGRSLRRSATEVDHLRMPQKHYLQTLSKPEE
jgi:3-methyladenine DNA glycosylase AlkC